MGRYDRTVLRPTSTSLDGHDTLEWIVLLALVVDGNIGTFGVSYDGFDLDDVRALGSSYIKAMAAFFMSQEATTDGHMAN